MRFLFIFLVSFIPAISDANIGYTRWTDQAILDDLALILAKLNVETGQNLAESDFQEIETRDLTNYRFKTFLQIFEDTPVEGGILRTWTDLKTNKLVQMEAHIEDAPTQKERQQFIAKNNLKGRISKLKLTSEEDIIKKIVSQHPDDPRIGKIKATNQWRGNDLVRKIQVNGKYGVHTIVVSLLTQQILETSYKSHPQTDVEALVYPIYEEPESLSSIQPRISVTLKNILNTRKKTSTDPYLPLQNRHYFDDKIDPVLAETPVGQAQGYWSFQWLLRSAQSLFNALPDEDNSYANGGLLLEGQYATINLHPDIIQLKGLNFSPQYSGRASFIWKPPTDLNHPVWEVIPTGAFRGLPLNDENSAVARTARRLPDHDVVSYINDGFDEVQVYYAVNRFMESLHTMGFVDPELSTRTFHAFLYDPDISMKDNAYYDSDTINFTTYSPKSQNFARDNSTIWHELGHGIMDRLMGTHIELADTGGLSEGMADFLAQLVVNDVSQGQPFEGSDQFRIMNQTGFNLTNEVHDDGESYGGAMKDIMDLALQKFGRAGLVKMTDLTLESMRLTRNHPGLTANDWFEHMLFADLLGSSHRASGEMKHMIVSAIEGRNFRFDRGVVAKTTILVGNSELTSESDGSREKPYRHQLNAGQEANYSLTLNVSNSTNYQFKFPVTVEVNYNGGPLQGAVHWKNEELGSQKFTISNESDLVKFEVAGQATCDEINRPDGSCSDFTYIKVFNNGEQRPVSKKRFYLRIKPI